MTITTYLEHHGCGSTGEVEALEEVRFWVKLATVALHNDSLGCALHTNSNINYSVACTKPHKGYPTRERKHNTTAALHCHSLSCALHTASHFT